MPPKIYSKFQLGAIQGSPDGKFIASGSEDKTVKLWKVDTGQCLKTLSSAKGGTVSSVAFSPDGVIFGEEDNKKLQDAQKAILTALGAVEKDD